MADDAWAQRLEAASSGSSATQCGPRRNSGG
jgi:hypothetical protein